VRGNLRAAAAAALLRRAGQRVRDAPNAV